jgi:hypothetical protein
MSSASLLEMLVEDWHVVCSLCYIYESLTWIYDDIVT